MSGKRYYAGAIWTTHALQRLDERGFTQKMAGQTFAHADSSFAEKKRDNIHYQRRFGKNIVTIIAKKNEHREWIILSCWIDPPIPGTKDEQRKKLYTIYRKASFWGKVWLIIKRQLGLIPHW
jgi:hypothetical protein